MRDQAERLFAALGDVREDFVEEAQEKPERQKRRSGAVWARCAAGAACVCLAVAAGAAILPRLGSDGSGAVTVTGAAAQDAAEESAETAEAAEEGEAKSADFNGRSWPVREIVVEGGGTEELMAADTFPDWDGLEIWQRYGELTLDGRAYHACGAALPTEKLGEELGSSSAGTVWDGEDRKGAPDSVGVSLRAIEGVARKCAVAVGYDGGEEWHAAQSWNYVPATLGDFIDDLNLRENMTFGTVHYEYDTGEEYTEVYDDGTYVIGRRIRHFEFDSVPAEKLWELLLANPGAENVYDQQDTTVRKTLLEISVNLPLFGEENLSLQVQEGGYLWTNLNAMTGKLFHVGEENTQAFVDYVLDECEGVEIVYVYPDRKVVGSSVPETERDDSSAVATESGLVPAEDFDREGGAAVSVSGEG